MHLTEHIHVFLDQQTTYALLTDCRITRSNLQDFLFRPAFGKRLIQTSTNFASKQKVPVAVSLNRRCVGLLVRSCRQTDELERVAFGICKEIDKRVHRQSRSPTDGNRCVRKRRLFSQITALNSLINGCGKRCTAAAKHSHFRHETFGGSGKCRHGLGEFAFDFRRIVEPFGQSLLQIL